MTDLARGAIVSFGERGEYTRKPRPGLVIQRTSTLDHSATVTLCGLTTTAVVNSRTRVTLHPSAINGLRLPSFVMVDKISSISRERIGKLIGHLEPSEMEAVDLSLRRWLDL